MNTIGKRLTLTTAGESHGPALVGILDGFPSQVRIDMEAVQHELDRRHPVAPGTTARREPDRVQVLSGIFEGVTTGAPIALLINNVDAHPGDYDALRDVYRPGHADYTYAAKYGVRDHRGGGRASARETALRVAAGAFALQALEQRGIHISAYTSCIGSINRPVDHPVDMTDIYSRPMRSADADTDAAMAQLVSQIATDGDSIGGIVSCRISGLCAGVGEPVYDKFQAMLASAMMSINAAKGFDYGTGFEGVDRPGSQIAAVTGGICGGITDGGDITFRVAFKPVATMMRPLECRKADGSAVTITPGGRHDACIVPRAVAVVRAMAALTTLDALLLK